MLRMWRWLRTHNDFNDLPDNHLVLEYDSSPNNLNDSPNDDSLHARPALRTRIMLVPLLPETQLAASVALDSPALAAAGKALVGPALLVPQAALATTPELPRATGASTASTLTATRLFASTVKMGRFLLARSALARFALWESTLQ